jgi:hypothetical protein
MPFVAEFSISILNKILELAFIAECMLSFISVALYSCVGLETGIPSQFFLVPVDNF